MNKIIIEIDPKTGIIEATLIGNSKIASDIMYDVCDTLRNRKNVEHISTELSIRRGED